MRSYSLSNLPDPGRYRITIKQEPHGVASTYVSTQLRTGDVLDVSEPRGAFTLRRGDLPVVLLSAGVGVTPVMAMLHALAAQAMELQLEVDAASQGYLNLQSDLATAQVAQTTTSLTYQAWHNLGRKSAFYYYEVSDGEDTLMFTPSEYVDITEVEPLMTPNWLTVCPACDVPPPRGVTGTPSARQIAIARSASSVVRGVATPSGMIW